MGHDQVELNSARLLELLQRQQELYHRLRVLSDRQKALIAGDESEPLLAILGERQRLVDALMGLTALLAPYRQDWTHFYAGLDEPSRKQVALVLEEVNGALGTILQSDNRDSATLTARRHQMVEQLASYDAGSRACSAYARTALGAQSNLTDATA